MIAVGLTPQQQRLFRFIEREVTEGRPAPTFGEMREHLGLRSKSGVHRLVEALVERGHIVRLAYRTRAIALPGSPGEVAMRQAAIRDEQARIDSASGGISVALPPHVANALLEFCNRERRIPSDVVVASLLETMRGRP